MGVEIVLNHKVEDLMAERAAGGFDAVFLAVGAHLSRRQDIPARDAGRIYDALQFLEGWRSGGEPPQIGRRVAIYGGGNTAMDAARTVRRLGADEPLIIYRRTRAQMPAHGFEADEAIEEGVAIHWLRTIKQIDGTTMTVEGMALDEQGGPSPPGVRDARGRLPHPRAGPGHRHRVPEEVPGSQFPKDGTVVVGPDLQTGCAGVFAGGDMVPFDRTVTTAVGHGRKAAQHRRMAAATAGVRASHTKWPATRCCVLVPRAATQQGQSSIEIERRRQTFDEVIGGLAPAAARYEAQRCLSCGNCFECDGCYAACPEGRWSNWVPAGAMLRLHPMHRVCDLLRPVPVRAITMVPEAAGPLCDSLILVYVVQGIACAVNPRAAHVGTDDGEQVMRCAAAD